MKTKTLTAITKKGLDKRIQEFMYDNAYAEIIDIKFSTADSFAVLILYKD